MKKYALAAMIVPASITAMMVHYYFAGTYDDKRWVIRTVDSAYNLIEMVL